MANQCGNGNYLDQPAWGPAPEPMPWYSQLWIIVCSYWMSGEPLPLQFTKQQKRDFGKHILIALGILIGITFVILILAYGQGGIRGY